MNLDKDFKLSDLTNPKVFKQAFGIHPCFLLAAMPFITIALIAMLNSGGDRCDRVNANIDRLAKEGSALSDTSIKLRVEAYELYCDL